MEPTMRFMIIVNATPESEGDSAAAGRFRELGVPAGR